MAGFMADNIEKGILKQWYIEDLETIKKDANAFLLDTRTVKEFESGHIEGFTNIPVDDLRERINEIPDKKIYVICQSGLRSYIATRILSGCGFDAYNFTGGFRFYSSVTKDKELTKQEYERLLNAARKKGNKRLMLIMQTICSSGIRVSELKFVTCEAVIREFAEIKSKGKIRRVFLPKSLCVILKRYIREQKLTGGSVFVSRTGKPIDRSNIWSDMKKLCDEAAVLREKVFPHNLRHLFARTFYTIEKDIVRLADILGHSSINTTRIYTMETGEIHQRKIQKLGLVHIKC